MNTPISENDPSAEDAPARVQPGRDPESWARELPAPLPAAEVEAACRELLSVPVGERREVLDRRAGHHGAAGRIQIVAALVDRGYALRHSDPHGYVRIAQVARQCAYRYIASLPDTTAAGRQLRAGAVGFLANAYRIVGKLKRAERCWERVTPEEVRNPVLAGKLFWFRASLARDSRRFPKAIDDLRQSLGRFESVAPAEGAQAAAVLAKIHEDAGDLDAALRAHYETLALIDGRRQPRLAFIALHNLAHLLTELERFEEAAHFLERAGWRYSAVGEPLARLRGRGIEGRLLRELGALEEAAAALREVVEGFAARELHYDAAVAGLELALTLARGQDSVAVMRLAEELYPVFVAHDIPREARMTLLEFAKAAEDLRADAKLISRVLAQLKEIERRPLDASA